MAGANMKSIKGRIKSVESTRQITKAMELVASSKLRRAKQQEEAVQPFYSLLEETIADIVKTSNENSEFISDSTVAADSPEGVTCYIVIAGDRGLAGGYNNNLFRMLRDEIKPNDCVIPVGKKSLDYYSKQSYEILTTDFTPTAEIGITESHEIGAIICKNFLAKRISKVKIAYTEFRSMLTQVPQINLILPLSKSLVNDRTDSESEAVVVASETIYEPSPQEVLQRIIPQYVSGMIYGAVCEALASEFAARRTAMNAANKNADEMISTLTLQYNRARQSMITQEITEIIAGSSN